MSDMIRIKTKDLHPFVQKLIKEMRAGMGQWRGEREREGMAPRKPKRFAPREVVVEFYPAAQVKVNIAGFSIHAVNGVEVARDADTETWMGSDGEPNYTQNVTFSGPVVEHRGYGRYARVSLMLPTGLALEGTWSDADGKSVEAYSEDGIYKEGPFRAAVKEYTRQLAAGNVGFLKALVDLAIEGKPFPKVAEPKADVDVVDASDASAAAWEHLAESAR